MLRKFLIASALCIASSFSIFVLYLTVQPDKEIKNGFSRAIEESAVYRLRTITINIPNYDFAGWIGDKCYLRNVDVPFKLIEITGERISDTIAISRIPHLSVGEVVIDASKFYLADLNRYTIYTGSTQNWNVTDTIHKVDFFSEFIPVFNSSVVLRTFSLSKTEFRLTKEQSIDSVIDGSGLLEKQIDGLFCTDGMLRFDTRTKRIVYTYFYRNQFICADTSLNLTYRANTIDTTSRARISVFRNEKENNSKLSSPPFIVNRRAVCHQGRLFINSNLIADNENHDQFEEADVIDVYDLNDGSYSFSFYVPRNGNKRLAHFNIHNEFLYVLRDDEFVVYHFSKKILNKFLIR